MRVFKGGFYPTTIFLGAYSGDFGSRHLYIPLSHKTGKKVAGQCVSKFFLPVLSTLDSYEIKIVIHCL